MDYLQKMLSQPNTRSSFRAIHRANCGDRLTSKGAKSIRAFGI
jgi:hypothetical protein